VEKLMKGKTDIVIAHPRSTIRNADKIAVLDEGLIVEMSTHEELIAFGGLSRRFVERQFAAARTEELPA